MTTVDNRINDASLVGVKHSLRSADRGEEDILEEEVLMQEEEKMMDDEEIFSQGDSDDDDASGDMIGGAERVGRSTNKSTASDDDASSRRYGLRRQRRQSGSDLERLEMFQSTKTGGLAKAIKSGPSSKAILSPASKAMPPPSARTRKPKVAEKLDFSDSKPMNTKDISLVPNPLLMSSELDKEDSMFDDHAVMSDKRKVTISTQPPVSRKRGYSIDSLGGLSAAFSDDNSANVAAAADGHGRDRAFSFECFAFGINADEPLPPLEASSSAHLGDSHGARPRGDSIIFDPVSFQDGGIHEQTALYSIDDTSRPLVVSKPMTTKPISLTNTKSSTFASEGRSADSHAGNVTVSQGSPRAPSTPSSTVTLSMDLLNRDGRIGIYLPEARRARIARFLAKRQRRVWRKRIKYDCRKKLADSRPRIKGRFVKRADNDDE